MNRPLASDAPARQRCERFSTNRPKPYTSAKRRPSGDWTIGFGSDDGGRLIVPGITFLTEVNTDGDAGLDDEVRHFWRREPMPE